MRSIGLLGVLGRIMPGEEEGEGEERLLYYLF